MIKKEPALFGFGWRAECHTCDNRGEYVYHTVIQLVEDMSRRSGAPMGVWVFEDRGQKLKPIPYCHNCKKKFLAELDLPLITGSV